MYDIYFYRKAQEEIAALTQMAEQFNSKMAYNNHNNNGGATEIQSMDELDNLFSFLTDVHPAKSNQIIEEIGEKMNELVENLEDELESVIQQEIKNNEKERLKYRNSAGIVEVDKNLINGQKKGPSLPEPTEPPPPPPPPAQFSNGLNGDIHKRAKEPIYESVRVNGVARVMTNGNVHSEKPEPPPLSQLIKEPQENKKVSLQRVLVQSICFSDVD